MSTNVEGVEGRVDWDVVMLGPSRVGKTSLLTALRVAGQAHFEGTPISIEPDDEHTKRAFNDNDNMMRGELGARKFSPDSLPGDEDEHIYGLAVNAGIDQHRIVLRFRDYPGAWLHDSRSAKVKEFLQNASAVIVPIDATLLMEAGQEQAQALAKGLALSEVEENVREWAKGRKGDGDAALLILAPVKCEAYFSDNGGRRSKADALFDRVRAHYADVVDAYLKEGPDRAEVLYAPVDTIGPIELMDVRWENSTGQGDRMKPVYRVRVDAQGRTVRRSVKGAEPVLAYLMRDILLTLDDMLKHECAEADRGIRDVDKRTKNARSNWWKRFWDTAFGERDNRNAERNRLIVEKTAANESLRQLAERASAVSPNAEYSRVRPWN